MANDSDTLRLERRRRLLALARTVNPGPNTPAKMTPISYVSAKPCYTPAELGQIVQAAHVQPSAARQRDLAAVVGLCAGAGAGDQDLRTLRVKHVEDRGKDGLLVHFQEPRPRTVAVRRQFETLLRAAIADRVPDELLLGKKADRRNIAASAVAKVAGYKLPHIEPNRLRATWLADLMTDQIPVGLILKAAGLQSARTLADLQVHIEPWLSHKGLSLTDDIRGAA